MFMFIFMKSFAAERGPNHFFDNHENDGTFEIFFSKRGFRQKENIQMEG